mmetsp:Transcript_21243/g.40311  ORF Transcript_21243/g.40311 Transcript_21243/m.40311 type:complete len:231 (-) Transcript_21243:27-719(-)
MFQMLKGSKKVDQEMVHVSRDVVFVLGHWTVAEARRGGLFDVEHGGGLGPRIRICLQWSILVGRINHPRREFRYGNGTTTKKVARPNRRASRTARQVNGQGIVDLLMMRFKEPKHEFPFFLVFIEMKGNQSRVHGSLERRKDGFNVLQTLDEKFVWIGLKGRRGRRERREGGCSNAVGQQGHCSRENDSQLLANRHHHHHCVYSTTLILDTFADCIKGCFWARKIVKTIL